MPKLTFVSPVVATRWYYDTPFKEGIGGSENNHIEMCSGLAELGYDVVSYAPVPDKFNVTISRNVVWLQNDKIDYSREGIWFLYRSFRWLPNLKVDKTIEQKIYVVVCDLDIFEKWEAEQVAKVDKFVVMCQAQKNYMSITHPEIADKIIVSSGGIRSQMIQEAENECHIRDPKAIIYCSSPDRGLGNLFGIFVKALEFVPDLKLNIFYGFDHYGASMQDPRIKHILKLVDKYKRILV